MVDIRDRTVYAMEVEILHWPEHLPKSLACNGKFLDQGTLYVNRRVGAIKL